MIIAALLLSGAAEAKVPFTCVAEAGDERPWANLTIQHQGEIVLTVEDPAGESALCDLEVQNAHYGSSSTGGSYLTLDFDKPRCPGGAYSDARIELKWKNWKSWKADSESPGPALIWNRQTAPCEVDVAELTGLHSAIVQGGPKPASCTDWALTAATGEGGTVPLAEGWPESGVFTLFIEPTGGPPSELTALRIRVLREGHHVTHHAMVTEGGERTGSISARNLFVPGKETRFWVTPSKGETCEISVKPPPPG